MENISFLGSTSQSMQMYFGNHIGRQNWVPHGSGESVEKFEKFLPK